LALHEQLGLGGGGAGPETPLRPQHHLSHSATVDGVPMHAACCNRHIPSRMRILQRLREEGHEGSGARVWNGTIAARGRKEGAR
jgi:hypothetical protein